MYLDDRKAAPQWRTVGTFTAEPDSILTLGDPCYGDGEPVANGRMLPGEWAIQVRDADETGTSITPVWETRFTHVSAGSPIEPVEYTWADDLGRDHPAPFPAGVPGQPVWETRGVDSGTMRWTVSVGRPDQDEDEDDWMGSDPQGALTVVPGHIEFISSSGYGDGGYPVLARLVEDRLVEAIIRFISVEPPTITPERFTDLVPEALDGLRSSLDDWFTALTEDQMKAYFDQAPDAPVPPDNTVTARGRLGLLVRATTYDSVDQETRTQVTTSAYQFVFGVVLPDIDAVASTYAESLLRTYVPGHQFVYGDNQAHLMESLWSRLSDEGKATLTASEQVLSVVDEEPRGLIVSSQNVYKVVWLTDGLLPAAEVPTSA
jgi:hypothetical protein